MRSITSPIHYQFDPVQTTKTSVVGAINVLGLAKRLRVKVLQTSTSEAYGDPLVHSEPESYWGNVNPLGPRSCYDEGKRCAETLFSIIIDNTMRRLNLCEYSIPTGPACTRTTDTWCRISLFRHCTANQSPYSEKVRRRARSATSMIWSSACGL